MIDEKIWLKNFQKIEEKIFWHFILIFVQLITSSLLLPLSLHTRTCAYEVVCLIYIATDRDQAGIGEAGQIIWHWFFLHPRPAREHKRSCVKRERGRSKEVPKCFTLNVNYAKKKMKPKLVQSGFSTISSRGISWAAIFTCDRTNPIE